MSRSNSRALTWILAVFGLLAPSAADGQEPAAGRAPEVWAIVAGVDKYEDSAIPACQGAVRDARAVREWLVRSAGWSTRHVLLLQDAGLVNPVAAQEQPSDLRPTRANLAWALNDWLGGRVRPGDVVLIYFAGHAAALPPPKKALPGAPGRDLLLPIDAVANEPLSTGWAIDEAIDDLAARGENSIVCWLDTSLQGRGERAPKVAGADARAGGERWLNKLTRWPGVSAWLAADGKSAGESAESGVQSPFTGTLLNALGTRARTRNLLACLDQMNRASKLQEQGFRSRGGIPPELTLWSEAVRARSAPERTLLLQRGHADRVEQLAYTADGARIVSASWDSTVKIWRAADRMLLRALPEYFHYEGVTGLALGPSGQWVASGDGAGQVRVWDLVANREKRLSGPAAHSVRIVALEALPDDVHLVSADQSGKAWLWDVSGAELKGQALASGVLAIACARAPGPMALAWSGEDGSIHLHNSSGEPHGLIAGTGGIITRLALDADGSHLAAGDEDGRVSVWKHGQAIAVASFKCAGEVTNLELSARGCVLAGTAKSFALKLLDQAEPPRSLEVAEAVGRALFSPDGRWLAARSKETGRVQVWQVDDAGKARSLELRGPAGRAPAAVSLAFSPDSHALVTGDQDGGMRSWTLPAGEQGLRIAPRRGKVAGVSVSADRRYLLAITRDNSAEVWDLQEGRGFLSVEGLWTSGLITPDGNRLVLTSDDRGDIAVIDRASGTRIATTFARPSAQGGPGPVTWRFGASNVVDGDQMLAISRDGRRVAACSSEGPIACVWDLATGKLLKVVRDPEHQSPIAAVDLSADGKMLLTGDTAGVAKLWDLAGDAAQPRLLETFATPGEPVSAARIGPSTERRAATGTRKGRVLFWKAGGDRPTSVAMNIAAPVRTLAYTPDGRWLAVGGADKSVRLVSLERPRETGRLDFRHPHAEQVNGLVAWPDSSMVASASDDTTVRFWSLADQSLLGTLSAVQEPLADASGAANARGGSLFDTSWVVYTPDGLFDSSPGGERQVTWLREEEVQPLEQFAEVSHVFGLADWLRQGKRPPAPKQVALAPPRLSIEQPAPDVLLGDDRAIELDIALAEKGLADLRLYHNGVPVQSELELALRDDQKHARATVPLRQGINRFYAMASRAGSIDGRSNDVEVRYEGAAQSAQIHVLALGVSHYAARALQFAHLDATQIADYLHQHGVAGAGRAGERIVLTNEEVTNERVEKALRQLQARVKDRPQDTVVVFLAGHTDVRQERFCLLLSSAAMTPGPDIVALRGAQAKPGAASVVDDPTVVTYVNIYRNIARMAALERLVIVDACQAEAVFDDPGVKQIRRYVDDGARRARTSYIMAARRGEPAAEVSALRHGLLTYVLLKGMGDRKLEEVPGLAVFRELPNADLDHDRVITTLELRKFADLTLPILAAQFPLTVERSGANGQAETVQPTANLRQGARVQETGGRSFPLVEVPEVAPK